MTDYSFKFHILMPVGNLYNKLEEKYPDAKPVNITDPALLFGNPDKTRAAMHAKWVVQQITHHMHCAWYLRAATMKNWLFDFVVETGLVSPQLAASIETAQY